jgi:hypothetical protein
MDLDDKLKQLRRERDARTRSQKIRTTWEKIDGEDGLSVKQKLERLISLTDKGKGMAVRSEPGPPAKPRREPVRIIENSYVLGARYGQIPISMGLQIPGSILSFLSRDGEFRARPVVGRVHRPRDDGARRAGRARSRSSSAWPTTGTSASRSPSSSSTTWARRGRLLEELERFVGEMGFKSVVSYNGKAFDLPLIETRFALHRTPCPFGTCPTSISCSRPAASGSTSTTAAGSSTWPRPSSTPRAPRTSRGPRSPSAISSTSAAAISRSSSPSSTTTRRTCCRSWASSSPGRCLSKAQPRGRRKGRGRRHGPLRSGPALREGRGHDDDDGPPREGPWPGA